METQVMRNIIIIILSFIFFPSCKKINDPYPYICWSYGVGKSNDWYHNWCRNGVLGTTGYGIPILITYSVADALLQVTTDNGCSYYIDKSSENLIDGSSI